MRPGQSFELGHNSLIMKAEHNPKRDHDCRQGIEAIECQQACAAGICAGIRSLGFDPASWTMETLQAF